MSRTESVMVELGTSAPDFKLPDTVSGRTLSRNDIVAATPGAGGLLVMFLCVHCPFVKHVEEGLARLGQDYAGRIAIAAISSNDIEQYPQDGPEEMKRQAERLGWHFPYLLDQTQQVARSFEAACTPDFFLFDRDLKLAYRGQLDGSRPQRASGGGNDLEVTGEDLRRAIDEVLAGRQPDPNQRGSLGCNIKWRE